MISSPLISCLSRLSRADVVDLLAARRCRSRRPGRSSRPGSRRRTGGCGSGRTGAGRRGRPGRRSRRRSSGRGWSGRSSPAGSARSSPGAATSRRANSSSGTSRAIWSRSQRWKTQTPFSPIVFSSLRSRSAHFRAQKSANSGRSTRRSTSFGRLSGSGSARNARASSGVGQPADRVEVGPAEEDRRRSTGSEGLILQRLQLGEDVACRSTLLLGRPVPDEAGPVGAGRRAG